MSTDASTEPTSQRRSKAGASARGERSARRVAAARAAAAAGGLLSLSMVLLGQPISVGHQTPASQANVRTAAVPGQPAATTRSTSDKRT